MVGHLHLQAMDDSLKGKNREGLLDSPDSGLPPSPSPPFCSLSPALIESRSGSCTTPIESLHGYYKKESREGKLVRNKLLHFIVLIPRRADTYSCSLCPILHSDASVTQWIKGQRSSCSVMTLKEEKLKTWKYFSFWPETDFTSVPLTQHLEALSLAFSMSVCVCVFLEFSCKLMNLHSCYWALHNTVKRFYFFSLVHQLGPESNHVTKLGPRDSQGSFPELPQNDDIYWHRYFISMNEGGRLIRSVNSQMW